MAVATPTSGRWITSRGRHVFIKSGQSLEDALRDRVRQVWGDAEAARYDPASEVHEWREVGAGTSDKAWHERAPAAERAAAETWEAAGPEYFQMRADEAAGRETQTVKDWNAFLDKAPVYQGTVYRGMNVQNVKDLGWLDKKGATVTFDSSSSASKSRGLARDFAGSTKFGTPVMLKVNTRGGADLSGVQTGRQFFTTTEEVVLRRGRRYRVMDVQRRSLKEGGSMMQIELEEV